MAYVETPATFVREIQANLKQHLINQIEECRGRYTTKWNRYCSHTFEQILENIELNYNSGQVIDLAMQADLQQIQRSYKIDGFVQDYAWTDAASILEEVKNTNIHACYNPQVEYAVAVGCYGYPNYFVSVWVFVAALIPLQ